LKEKLEINLSNWLQTNVRFVSKLSAKAQTKDAFTLAKFPGKNVSDYPSRFMPDILALAPLHTNRNDPICAAFRAVIISHCHRLQRKVYYIEICGSVLPIDIEKQK